MNHTPGPWIAFRRNRREQPNVWIIGCERMEIDLLECELNAADALLIAAAPDMLDYLKQEYVRLEGAGLADSPKGAEIALLIAKAEGRSTCD